MLQGIGKQKRTSVPEQWLKIRCVPALSNCFRPQAKSSTIKQHQSQRGRKQRKQETSDEDEDDDDDEEEDTPKRQTRRRAATKVR